MENKEIVKEKPFDLSYLKSSMTLDELMEEIDQLESERKIMERKHINDIYRLKEDNHRRVMRMYYIDDLIIEKISNVMMLSENHVRKIKNRAEEEFISMIINDIKW